jgi:hypothetical protein
MQNNSLVLYYSNILMIKLACKIVDNVSLMASAFRDIKVAAESKIKNKKIHIYFKGSSALAPSLSLNSLGQSPLK